MCQTPASVGYGGRRELVIGGWSMVVSRVGMGGVAFAAAAAGAAGLAGPASAGQGRVSVLAPGEVERGALGPMERWTNPKRVERFVPPIPDRLSAAVKAAFGERFAGLYYWRARGKQPVLVLRLTTVTEADRAFVERSLLRPELRLLTSNIVLAPAEHSERDLERARDAIAQDLGTNGIVSAGIDPSSNQVVVTTDETAGSGVRAERPREAAARKRWKIRSGGVRWQSGQKLRLRAYPAGSPGKYGGTAITITGGGDCTAGFAINSAFGSYMTTAGHCSTNIGQQVYGDEQGHPNGAILTTLGKTALRATDGYGDVTWYGPAGFGRQWNGASTFYVQGAEDPGMNDWVCFHGGTSGLSCGNVNQVNTTQYPPGYPGGLGNQFCTNATSNPGDSGSGLWAPSPDVWNDKKVRIRGVLSSGGVGITCGTQYSVFPAAWGASAVTEGVPCA